MAGNRLEPSTGGVWMEFVVSADDPNFISMTHPDLTRSQYMACGMKGDLDPIYQASFSVGKGFDRLLLAKASFQQCPARFGTEIMSGTPSGVVSVGVGDEGTLHTAGGINVESTCFTVESLRFLPYQHALVSVVPGRWPVWAELWAG